MASFKERFKDKASVVGKDGSNAMLSPSQQPYLPNPQQQLHPPPYQPQQVPLSQKQQMSYLQLHQEESSGNIVSGASSSGAGRGAGGVGGWGAPPVVATTVAPGKMPSQPISSITASNNVKQPSSFAQLKGLQQQQLPQQQQQQQQQQQPSQQPPAASRRAQLPIAPVHQSKQPVEPVVGYTTNPAPSKQLAPHSLQQQQPQQFSQPPPSSFVPTGLFRPPVDAPPPQPRAQGSFSFAGGGASPGFQPTGMIQLQQQQQTAPAPDASKPRGVGSYNYGAASVVGSSSGIGDHHVDERQSPKKGRGADGGIRFGRRAGSSDGTTSNASKGVGHRSRDASRNRNSTNDEERPRTDPSAAALAAGSEVSPSRREVHYTPYSVNDYRRMKEELQKHHSRGLGPSDTDEQRAAAQRVQRQKEYAENIKRVNKLLSPSSPSSGDQPDESGLPATRAPIVQPTPNEVIEKQKMRDRANEYAKRVPKPKPKAAPAQETDISDDVAERAEELWGVGDVDSKKLDKERHLADLEARHAQDQQMVANLKKQLRI